LGVEGEISATSLKDSVSGTFVLDPGGPGRLPVIGRASAEASLDWISTLSGRFGWVVDPQWLVYGKVGAAWAHVSADAFAGISGGPSVSASFDDTFSGWLLGFGTEYALRDNWTAKFEYNMLDFGNDFGSNIHVFKAGLNYRFGYSPIPGPRGRY
jgi:outer membrane immunogenic protein